MTRLLASANSPLAQQSDAEMSKSQRAALGARPEVATDVGSRGQSAPSSGRPDLVQVQQLIDLTDKPIRLTRDEIGWSRVKANASNCVCCCNNNSITLVTTDDSYALDHIPLDHIEAAQASPSLKYLALANKQKLAVIELVETKPSSSAGLARAPTDTLNTRAGRPTRLVNLPAAGLRMDEVLFWRWIDELTLALVTEATLYTCQLDQLHVGHPASTALARPVNQMLALARVCDLEPSLGHLCQVTNVQRDESGNLFAISGLYSPQAIRSLEHSANTQPQGADAAEHLVKSSQNHDNNNNNNNTPPVNQNQLGAGKAALRHNFSSVPGRLSQMAANQQQQQQDRTAASPLEHQPRAANSRAIDSLRRKISASSRAKRILAPKCNMPTTIEGLAQIHCRLRDCSQVIRAHAVSFASKVGARTTAIQDEDREPEARYSASTTLVAANSSGSKLKVYFIGMATTEDLMTSGQNVARSMKLNVEGRADFPTAIVCSALDPHDERTHVAMVVTKHGRLFVCSLTRASILFDVQVCHDIVSGAVHDRKTGGLMLILRNGQVLLVRVDNDKLKGMLDEANGSTLRSIDIAHPTATNSMGTRAGDTRLSTGDAHSKPLGMGLEVIISTKL